MSLNGEAGEPEPVDQLLEQHIALIDSQNSHQTEIHSEFMKVFKKISQRLTSLANKIKDYIMIEQTAQNQSICNLFQLLSQGLVGLAKCSKDVAIKAKNQVFEPMKIFSANCKEINNGLLQNLKHKQDQVTEKSRELAINRQIYMQASEKLEKHRKGQRRMMAKIESGDQGQLDKFNNTIQKITENINSSEFLYRSSVATAKTAREQLRSYLHELITAVSHHEETRVSFSCKSAMAAIRILYEFINRHEPVPERPNQEDANNLQDNNFQKAIESKLELLSATAAQQQFMSYDQLQKTRRKKCLQQSKSHLQELFSQVTATDRQIIQLIIKPWFSRQSEPCSNKPFSAMQIDECKGKIMQLKPYSYYYIEGLYEKVQQMTSFYCKIVDEQFLFLVNSFQTITNGMELESSESMGEVEIEFLYKMVQISARIAWRKSSASRNQHIELLCQQYGRRVEKFNNSAVLNALFEFLQKKKIQRKQAVELEDRGVMNSFAKGFNALISRKKSTPLTDTEIFTCLQELTNMMGNLQVSTEVSIPFLKSLVGRNENRRSFEYLRAILIEKKNQRERQKIFFRTEVKEKRQHEMRQAIENRKMAEYCLQITAQRGYFDSRELNLRLVSRALQWVHQDILAHLRMQTQHKWIHLIPLDRKLNYVDMKQEVADKSVPSRTEDIITLDVNRSLPNHGERLNPTVLHSLLRTYAYFHQDISYCQGMNYIAGYLYLKTKGEEQAYRIFQYLMETRFKELFANQFRALKIKMYQFERLLSIFHPEISEHFSKQAVTPECYIVSWIITLFASSYQHTMQSHLIDMLWERFLLRGWPEFFKFVLSLFMNFKEELLQLTYDRALNFLGEMARSPLFLADDQQIQQFEAAARISEGIQQFSISAELLLNLQQEYVSINSSNE